MPAETNRQTLRAAEALVAVAPLVTRWLERVLAASHPPLTVAQFLVLRGAAAGQLSAADLAARTGVSGAAISQLVGALAAAGLIERRTLPDDRRRQELSLTRSGATALDAALGGIRAALGELLVDLPPHEADALARTLALVEAALSGAPPPRRPGPGPRPPRPRRPPP